MMQKFYISVNARINGKEVELKDLHCSITSTGFDHFAGLCFNSNDTRSPANWIKHILSTGAVVNTSIYSVLAPTTHQHYFKYMAGAAGSWTGGAVMFSNSTSTQFEIANATWTAINYAAAETLELTWLFNFAGTDFNNDGFARMGALVLNTADTYGVFNYIALLSGGVEVERKQAVYSKISNTQHKLSYGFSQGGDELRYYNALVGGSYCYAKTGLTIPVNTNFEDTITLSQ